MLKLSVIGRDALQELAVVIVGAIIDKPEAWVIASIRIESGECPAEPITVPEGQVNLPEVKVGGQAMSVLDIAFGPSRICPRT